MSGRTAPTGAPLSKLERAIVAANPAGRPWSRVDIAAATTTADALARFNLYRAAFGIGPVSSAVDFLTVANWPRRKSGNVKLEKVDAVTAGVTYLPAAGAADWARDAGPAAVARFARAVGEDPAHVAATIARATVCARSTAGCRAGCVISTSGRAAISSAAARNAGRPWWDADITRGRLVRTLLLALEPAAALRLMLAGITALGAVGRAHKLPRRWRLAVADDIRWEVVAPGLLTAARGGNVRPYAYTKYRPAERPEPRGSAFTYSASERWTVREILAAVDAGHRVAVVLDTPRGRELPPNWCGRPVVDGDATDDQHAHPRGVIVALRAKGSAVGGRFVFPTDTAAALERMAREDDRPSVAVLIGRR